jgi:two-component system sensor histidine kinase AlgZ
MKTQSGGEHTIYLPDFCTSHAALAIVLIVELTAFVLALARQSAVDFWTDLVRTSLFLLWIGLAGAGLLCALRTPLMRATAAAASAGVLGLITLVIASVSACAYLFGRTHMVIDSGGAGLFPQSALGFTLRNVCIGLVVTGLALRYFYVAHEWRRSVELRATARVHALQARIRPHFLFNSMNTIAALTRSYQRMEQLRLGGRLQVEWKIEPLPPQALVPSLMIQPLLENAIYHGIEPRAEGGTVTITGDVGSGLITIVVRNPLDPTPGARDGNRLALANIRERLSLLYGERALLKAGQFDAEYIVTLRFPLLEKPPAAAAAQPA